MANELVVTPEVEVDIAEAYQWYETRRRGLGEEFLSSIEACVKSTCREPGIYPIVHGCCRRALIRRFPYVVFFEHEEGTITIYAVFHTSRDPAKWRQRLR